MLLLLLLLPLLAPLLPHYVFLADYMRAGITPASSPWQRTRPPSASAHPRPTTDTHWQISMPASPRFARRRHVAGMSGTASTATAMRSLASTGRKEEELAEAPGVLLDAASADLRSTWT